MLYAHVTGGTIEQVGALPRLWFDGTRWWDLRDDAHDPAALGWLPVTVEPRPDDTETTTWDRAEPDLVEGVPVIGWTERDKAPEELQAEADAAAARARYETHEGILDATAALMEDAHEDGAAWVQPQGAHNAYPLGRTVTHNGKTWENITPANVWEPGDAADPQSYRWWREVTEPDPGEGPHPWNGSGHAYAVGDEVTYMGATYRVLQAHTSQPSWTPDVVPALYQVT